MTETGRRKELETLDQLNAKLERCAQRLEKGQTRAVIQLDTRELLTVARALGLYRHRLERAEEVTPCQK